MPDRVTLLLSPRPRSANISKISLLTLGVFLAAGVSCPSSAQSGPPAAPGTACPGDNGGLTLSPGFCATSSPTISAMSAHMAVAPNGVLYVNTWSGRYFRNDTPPAGGFLVALKDTKAAAKPTSSSASATACRKVPRAAPASPSTRTPSTPS